MLSFVPTTAQAATWPTCTSTAAIRGIDKDFSATIPSLSQFHVAKFDCILQTSAVVVNSPAVKALQQNLNICYQQQLTVDGAFGPATKSALMAAQRKIGIAADGVYGPITRNNMLWFGNSYNCQFIWT